MPTNGNGDRCGRKRPQRNAHHKLSCNGCGAIARMTRKALAQMGAAPVCGCGFGPMQVESVEVAAAALPADALAQQAEYVGARDAEVRKALRENKTSGARLQCGGCHVFIPASNHHCRCGFANDIRGGRNDGRWVSGSARCAEWEDEQAHNDGMPF